MFGQQTYPVALALTLAIYTVNTHLYISRAAVFTACRPGCNTLDSSWKARSDSGCFRVDRLLSIAYLLDPPYQIVLFDLLESILSSSSQEAGPANNLSGRKITILLDVRTRTWKDTDNQPYMSSIQIAGRRNYGPLRSLADTPLHVCA